VVKTSVLLQMQRALLLHFLSFFSNLVSQSY